MNQCSINVTLFNITIINSIIMPKNVHWILKSTFRSKLCIELTQKN